jgi:hypothetical protein
LALKLAYRLDIRGIKVRFSAGEKNVSSLHRVQTLSGAYPVSYAMDTGGVTLSTGVKWPSPFSADVQNSRSIRLHVRVCLIERSKCFTLHYHYFLLSQNFIFLVLVLLNQYRTRPLMLQDCSTLLITCDVPSTDVLLSTVAYLLKARAVEPEK